jgi:hypothetical protein
VTVLVSPGLIVLGLAEQLTVGGSTSDDEALSWQFESVAFELVAGLKSVSGKLHGWP